MKTDFPNTPQTLRIYKHREHNTTTNMFIEDIHLGIMPINGESKNFAKFNAEFIGDDSNDAIILCKSLMRYDNYNSINDFISQIIENIAHLISEDGIALYEILYYKENKKIIMNGVSNNNIYDVLFCFIQYKSKDEIDKSQLKFLRKKNIWKIEMPLALGERSGYKKIISNLDKFDSSGPKFYLDELYNSQLNHRFDYKEYRLKTHIFTTKCTLNWSWDQRDLDRENKTEFYTFYQDLKFYWAKTVLREHIVKELNCLFKRLDIKSEIKIIGIPTAKEILNFKNEFRRGEKNYDDFLKFLLY